MSGAQRRLPDSVAVAQPFLWALWGIYRAFTVSRVFLWHGRYGMVLIEYPPI